MDTLIVAYSLCVFAYVFYSVNSPNFILDHKTMCKLSVPLLTVILLTS
jgi:hypothetical protein